MTGCNEWIAGQRERREGEKAFVCACIYMCVNIRGGKRYCVFMTRGGQKLSDSFSEADSN